MSKKERDNRLGIVFSTDPDFQYQTEVTNPVATLPPAKQKLYVELDKKQRAGKQVSIVYNFIGSAEDLTALAKLLKTKCGVGGSIKDHEIIIQGDFRTKIKEVLVKEGYSVIVK